MATYTDSLGFNKGSAALPSSALDKCHRVEMVLDFPKIIAARSAAGATALAASDVLEVIPVPAGTIVSNVGMEVTTAAGYRVAHFECEPVSVDVLNDADNPRAKHEHRGQNRDVAARDRDDVIGAGILQPALVLFRQSGAVADQDRGGDGSRASPMAPDVTGDEASRPGPGDT